MQHILWLSKKHKYGNLLFRNELAEQKSQQWPSLRNNKSVGQARAVVEGYYATN